MSGLRNRINRLEMRSGGGKLHVLVLEHSSVTQDEALARYAERGGIVEDGDIVVFCIDRFDHEETRNEH